MEYNKNTPVDTTLVSSLPKEIRDKGESLKELIDGTVKTIDFDAHKAESANKAHGGFKGVAVRKTTNQSVANNLNISAVWDEIIYDTDNFFNLSNPTRLTIPSGVSKVKVKVSILFEQNTNGQRKLDIKKNDDFNVGRSQMQVNALNGSVAGEARTAILAESIVLNVVQGDYFVATVAQSSSVSINLEAASSVWFALEVVE